MAAQSSIHRAWIATPMTGATSGGSRAASWCPPAANNSMAPPRRCPSIPMAPTVPASAMDAIRIPGLPEGCDTGTKETGHAASLKRRAPRAHPTGKRVNPKVHALPEEFHPHHRPPHRRRIIRSRAIDDERCSVLGAAAGIDVVAAEVLDPAIDTTELACPTWSSATQSSSDSSIPGIPIAGDQRIGGAFFPASFFPSRRVGLHEQVDAARSSPRSARSGATA